MAIILASFCTWMVQNSASIPLHSNAHYRISPPYKRHLKQVVFSLNVKQTNLNHLHELLLALPDTSVAYILCPEINRNVILNSLNGKPYKDQVQLVLFGVRSLESTHSYFLFPEKDKLVDSGNIEHQIFPYGSNWAQDLVIAATTDNGNPIALIPQVYRRLQSLKSKKALQVVSDNFFLQQLERVGIKGHALPFAGDGGNILVDVFNGSRIAFCGGDIIRCTQTMRGAYGQNDSEEKIFSDLKAGLNVDKLIVVGRGGPQPPSLLFHLDQAMILLDNGLVGVTRVVGKSNDGEIREVVSFLKELRRCLREIGYEIIDIDVTMKNVFEKQFYVNAIPFLDGTQKKLLMPAFKFSKGSIEQLMLEKNHKTYNELGFQVILVPTSSNQLNGGIHCLINVLA